MDYLIASKNTLHITIVETLCNKNQVNQNHGIDLFYLELITKIHKIK